ncbi:MAG: hypothetical protein ACTSW1_12945 [Candidatus Hodarchaeales archaeon]
MKEFFMKRETYVLGTLMGAFFSYIGTTVFIPIHLDKAVVPGEAVTLPPVFTIIFFVFEIITAYLGILLGAVWTQKIKKRRPVMTFGGLLAGSLAILSFTPFIHDITMLSEVLKTFTIFFVCICLAAWTYAINEVSPEKSGMQIGAILTIAAMIGSFVPILQSFLLSIGLFEVGWFLSSVLLLLMGVMGYLSPETYYSNIVVK